jgi:cysteine-rich secretory family protein/Calx-beta domain-containing protein
MAVVASAAMISFVIPNVTYASPSLDTSETELCGLINEYRAANGLQPLLVSQDLNEASDWHTDDMVANNYLSHTDSLGRTAFDRMAAFGYNYATAKGENIAAGSASAFATLTQWKNSAPHNANILSSSYKVIGIAHSYGAGTTYGHYWNNTFGGFVDAGATPCSGSPTPSPSPTASPSPSPTAPVITINDVSLTEGTGTPKSAKFTVTLSQTSPSAVAVTYTTVNNTAVYPTDYTKTSGTLNIPAGQTTGTISVPITRDSVKEPDEMFKLNLSNPVGGTIGDFQAIGTIRNDD